MVDDPFGEQLDDIIRCIETRMGGRDATMTSRRRAMLEFLHYSSLYSVGASDQSLVTLMDHVAGYFQLCSDGLDRLLDEPADAEELTQQVYEEVDEVWLTLAQGIEAVEEALGGSRKAEARELCSSALASVFNWKADGHHRAHVYIRTGEKLADGLLGKERSLLLKAVRDCLKEIHP
jgi:hypothetical protein